MPAKPQASGSRKPRAPKPTAASFYSNVKEVASQVKALGMPGYSQRVPRPRRGHR